MRSLILFSFTKILLWINQNQFCKINLQNFSIQQKAYSGSTRVVTVLQSIVLAKPEPLVSCWAHHDWRKNFLPIVYLLPWTIDASNNTVVVEYWSFFLWYSIYSSIYKGGLYSLNIIGSFNLYITYTFIVAFSTVVSLLRLKNDSRYTRIFHLKTT